MFEVDVDVGSSRAANTVVGLVAPATKSLVITLGIALEGHSEEVCCALSIDSEHGRRGARETGAANRRGVLGFTSFVQSPASCGVRFAHVLWWRAGWVAAS